MAIIKCPECGRENVSNTAESCPNCGYDVKMHFQNAEKLKIEHWKKRIDSALKKDEKEKIEELIIIGKEGCYSGYLQVGLHYDTKGDFEKAFEYYMLSYYLAPENPNILNNIGYLYSKPNFSKFNIELAIKYLIQSDCGTAHNNLAGIYSNKNNDKYFDANKAIEHYNKAIQKGYKGNQVLNNLGVLYGDYKKDYVAAASYCYMSAKYGNEQGEKNYNIFISLVPNRYIWENKIKNLKNIEEIKIMLEDTNHQINSNSFGNNTNTSKQKIYSQKAKLLYVFAVIIIAILAMWILLDDLGTFSFELIFYIVVLAIAVGFPIYYYFLSDNRPTFEEMVENHKKEKYNDYQYTCPQCGSKKVKKIGTLNRSFSVYLFGLASSKIGKQYHCDNCNHKW